MPIAKNLGAFGGGSRLPKDDGGEAAGSALAFSPALRGAFSTMVQPEAVASAATAAMLPRPAVTLPAGIPGRFDPAVLTSPPIVAVPPISAPPPISPVPRTTTQLARGAIDQLSLAAPAVLNEALNAVGSRGLTGEGIMDYLERKVRVGEVLGLRAADWSAQTKADVADAFQMGADRLDVMDSIVSLAILNDRDLEAELRAENIPQTSQGDLVGNRRIVWQYPDAGTVLTPPYMILVAVEYQDVAQADDIVRSLLGQLGTAQRLRLPQAAIQKL